MKKIYFLMSFLFLLVINSIYADNMSARKIIELVDERYDGDSSQFNTEMILINKRGKERIRSIKSYSKDYGKDKKSVMFFDKPADVKGTSFLSWEYDDPNKDDAKWLYLPALRKVRRINSSSDNDYFMGSDFTYEDMGDKNIDEDKYEFVSENENVEGHDCWIIKATPIKEKIKNSYRILTIRKDLKMAVKIDYYKKGMKTKILILKNITKIDNIWFAKQMFMDNIEKKHKTIINFENIKFNQKIDDNIFSVSTIERGKIK